jgi:hypothetical protein
MQFEASKRVRALVRDLAATAYERELQGYLTQVEQAFVRWRKGEIDARSLADEVDEFSRGRARHSLEQRYRTTRIMHMNVAQAIARGILRTDEVPGEVLDALERAIEFYRKGLADGSISFEPEED